MKAVAVLVVISAWACLFLWRGTVARVTQLIVFGLLGTIFTLAGGFAYWWDSHMMPSQSSSLLLDLRCADVAASGGHAADGHGRARNRRAETR